MTRYSILFLFLLSASYSAFAMEVNEKNYPSCKDHIKYEKNPKVKNDDCKALADQFNQVAFQSHADCIGVSNELAALDAAYDRITKEGDAEVTALTAKMGDLNGKEAYDKVKELKEGEVQNFQKKNELIVSTRDGMIRLHDTLARDEKSYQDVYKQIGNISKNDMNYDKPDCRGYSRDWMKGWVTQLDSEITAKRKEVAVKIHALNDRQQRNFLIIGASKEQALQMTQASISMGSEVGTDVKLNKFGGTDGASRGITDKVQDFFGISRSGAVTEKVWKQNGQTAEGLAYYDHVEKYNSRGFSDEALRAITAPVPLAMPMPTVGASAVKSEDTAAGGATKGLLGSMSENTNVVVSPIPAVDGKIESRELPSTFNTAYNEHNDLVIKKDGKEVVLSDANKAALLAQGDDPSQAALEKIYSDEEAKEKSNYAALHANALKRNIEPTVPPTVVPTVGKMYALSDGRSVMIYSAQEADLLKRDPSKGGALFDLQAKYMDIDPQTSAAYQKRVREMLTGEDITETTKRQPASTVKKAAPAASTPKASSSPQFKIRNGKLE